MIPDRTGKRIAPVSDDEKIAKVFVVVAGNTRRCLICDQLFTRQCSFEHSKTICYPPASAMN